jgi:hypothetical protein
MKEYLLVFRAVQGQVRRSPEQTSENMELWKKWIGTLAEAGKMVGGQPLKPGGRLMSRNNITDAPFAEGKEVLNGYVIVKATDYEEAEKLSKGCPIFGDNGTLEIREIALMDM